MGEIFGEQSAKVLAIGEFVALPLQKVILKWYHDVLAKHSAGSLACDQARLKSNVVWPGSGARRRSGSAILEKSA